MHQFDQDILFEPEKPDSYSGDITENWSISGVPNGGYLMAITANAMLQCSEVKATPIITTNFLNRCEPGEATVSIERMSKSKQSESKGWIKFKDNRAFDTLSILLIADSFPPAVFSSQGMVAWVPTLEFSVNIRNIPTTTWLKCIFRTRFITCGLIEEDGEIWDQNGELIAISRQIAQYRAHTQ